MTAPIIVPLADRPAYADLLADWHHSYWGELLPWWSHADALRELRDHATRQTPPTTWIALGEGGALLGSCSLVDEDIPDFARYSPWLASLFVAPEARGLGVGTALTHRVVEEAARAGHSTLYLFTTDRETFYTRLGWALRERVDYHGESGVILQLPLRQDSPVSSASAGQAD